MTEALDEFDAKLLLGRYRVVRKLGQGGMGTVHLARLEGAEGFTKPVVVKRMRPDIRSTEEGNRLFKREAQILSKMHHPGIVNIIDFGVEDGAHIMVLEYVHGYTLAPWLDFRFRRDLPLPVDVCIFIIRKVLDALHYAHHFEVEDGQEVQVVHRDVAPDNVLLSKKGYVHLLDFGVASMSGMGRGNSTKSGIFRGKLGYASPETVNGHPATPRSDLYSAAVMLLELLTQQTPFLADSMGETIQRMVSEVPLPASAWRTDIQKGLDETLAKALHKQPEQRYESALAFSKELRRFQQQDDDEVAQQLKRIAGEDFDHIPEEADVEPLRVREEALARVFSESQGFREWSNEVLASDPLQETLAEARFVPGARASQHEITESTGQKRLRGILLGLLVVGGLIALALGAAVALLSRSGTGEQVVVVGGENTNSSPTLGRDSDGRSEGEQGAEAGKTDLGSSNLGSSRSAAPATLDQSATAAQAERAGSPSGQAVAAAAGNSKSASTTTAAHTLTLPQTTAERQALLSRAVQNKSADFQLCFAQDLKSGGKVREATLHFSVSERGGKAEVNIRPSAVAQGQLGGCLSRAAGRVVFPPLGESVAFSVPVKAHITSSAP